MFSGIVETLGIVESIQSNVDCLHAKIVPNQDWRDIHLGDSVAVNGVCLTITQIEAPAFYVSIVPETLRVTNLGLLSVHECVNLERAMTLNSRLGGHFVQGHVDLTSPVLDLQKEGEGSLLATIHITPEFSKYVVNKGFITIDGMSITVIKAKADYFTVTFIPHTQTVTRVNQYKIGTHVNLEVDMIGKYLEKLLEARGT